MGKPLGATVVPLSVTVTTAVDPDCVTVITEGPDALLSPLDGSEVAVPDPELDDPLAAVLAVLDEAVLVVPEEGGAELPEDEPEMISDVPEKIPEEALVAEPLEETLPDAEAVPEPVVCEAPELVAPLDPIVWDCEFDVVEPGFVVSAEDGPDFETLLEVVEPALLPDRVLPLASVGAARIVLPLESVEAAEIVLPLELVGI